MNENLVTLYEAIEPLFPTKDCTVRDETVETIPVKQFPEEMNVKCIGDL